jgi:hypothetical protein
VPNPGQADEDLDFVGDACDSCPGDPGNDPDADGVCALVDNCPDQINADQSDIDLDGFGDLCDSCPEVPNLQSNLDLDQDGHGDECDNCPSDPNPAQRDMNADGEGDLCDLDDGVIYLTLPEKGIVEWQPEYPFYTWNLYRGDLDQLVSTGEYTQAFGSNPLASRTCDLGQLTLEDSVVPDPGVAAYYLTTGITLGGSERRLGSDSAGALRPNHNPCP